MYYTHPNEETVDRLARHTGLERLYTTSADEHGTKWTLSVSPVTVRETDNGAAWMMIYLAALARYLDTVKRIHSDSQDVLDGIAEDELPQEAPAPDDQAANDARKPLTRERAGA